jgi:hypothetical protein
MPRTLTVLFRRDPRRDHRRGEVDYEGYHLLWPDGRPVAVGIDSFCRHGQRLLRLGRHLAGLPERRIELLCYLVAGVEAPLTRLPGSWVRRLFLERSGGHGRLHFLDGTPTTLVFDLARDEPAVLDWIGLAELGDGQRQWLDLAARTVDSAPPPACGAEVRDGMPSANLGLPVEPHVAVAEQEANYATTDGPGMRPGPHGPIQAGRPSPG